MFRPDPLIHRVSLVPAWSTGPPGFTCSRLVRPPTRFHLFSLVHSSTEFHVSLPDPPVHQISISPTHQIALAPACPVCPPNFSCPSRIHLSIRFHLPRPGSLIHQISVAPLVHQISLVPAWAIDPPNFSCPCLIHWPGKCQNAKKNLAKELQIFFAKKKYFCKKNEKAHAATNNQVPQKPLQHGF